MSVMAQQIQGGQAYRGENGIPPASAIAGIPEALQSAARQMDSLEDRLSTLCARLESGGVLRPALPSGESSARGGAPVPMVCALAGEIQTGSARLAKMHGLVCELLQRLDV